MFQPNNSHRQEQTHFFTRDINTLHHDCPFCNQPFYYTQSNFIQNASAMSKSGFHQAPLMTNTSICDNPACVVCANAPPKQIDFEETYEYQRNLPTPCQVCGDHSFAHGIAPFNTLTLRASQFAGSSQSFISRSPTKNYNLRQSYAPPPQRPVVDYGHHTNVSKSTILPPNNMPPAIGNRLVIKTPKTEYRDVCFCLIKKALFFRIQKDFFR